MTNDARNLFKIAQSAFHIAMGGEQIKQEDLAQAMGFASSSGATKRPINAQHILKASDALDVDYGFVMGLLVDYMRAESAEPEEEPPRRRATRIAPRHKTGALNRIQRPRP